MYNKMCSKSRTGLKPREIKELKIFKLKLKLHGLSPRANYTDRATAACLRNKFCQQIKSMKSNAGKFNVEKSFFPAASVMCEIKTETPGLKLYIKPKESTGLCFL
jgi:hypothetical protein